MVVSQFYLDIMGRLRGTIKDHQNAPAIKYMDLWNRQTDYQDEEGNQEYPFNTPSTYLELLPGETITLGRKKQICELTFLLHVVSEVYGEHSSREEEAVRKRSLSHLELLDQIYVSLQNHRSDYFNSINRIGIAIPDTDHSQIYVHALPFKTLITDVAAMNKLVHVTPQLMVKQGTIH